MSNVVDRRVVEMQFDNRDFENNIKTSMQSLGKLKESLKLEDSAKELKAFEKTAGKFSLDGMISAAESMKSKFSVMGTVGDQVLRRLTDSAMTAFYQMKRFVNSLTIDPIYSGFDEYNTQINSIQTILSNTREDLTSRGFDDAGRLGEVTTKLDELNSYADKTIYNFTEMTRNIGTFTAAGVDLYIKIDYDLENPANNTYVFGSEKPGLTERYRKDKKEAQKEASRSRAGGGGAGSAAAEEAQKQLDKFYDAWIDFDKETAHVSLGAVYKELQNAKDVLVNQVGIDLDAPSGNINIYNLKQSFDELGNTVQTQSVTINTLNTETKAQLEMITALDARESQHAASFVLRADAMESDIEAKADRITLEALEVDINSELTRMNNLIATKITADDITSDIVQSRISSMTTLFVDKALSVGGRSYMQDVSTSDLAVGGVFHLNAQTVSSNKINIVTDFTQASTAGWTATPVSMGLLTTSVGNVINHTPEAGSTTTFN